jgi:hypothetical protein
MNREELISSMLDRSTTEESLETLVISHRSSAYEAKSGEAKMFRVLEGIENLISDVIIKVPTNSDK